MESAYIYKNKNGWTVKVNGSYLGKDEFVFNSSDELLSFISEQLKTANKK